MSRDFGAVRTALWASRKFVGLTDDQARLLYLYLHTCPHGNSIGCFRLPKGYATADLHWSTETLDRAIKVLCEADLIGWNEAESVVRIVAFLDKSPITNTKHGMGAVRAALSLPDCDQKTIACKELAGSKFIDPAPLLEVETETTDSPIEALREGCRTETSTSTETNTPDLPSGDHPPTKNAPVALAEKREARGHRLPDDWRPPPGIAEAEGLAPDEAQREADKFRDYWRAQPGVKGRKTDWDATWRNWIRRAADDRKPKQRAASGGVVSAFATAGDSRALWAELGEP